ncbi:hypothetical protein [Oryzibacter oryziterrae]|uniref:hypothetical protein n=1 Tax=Oryzibacter oryziterrae TaxID=2766474 RepID=UPI001F3C9ED0|nr:hypothetical protein [Oryzibacter oryziterrae]
MKKLILTASMAAAMAFASTSYSQAAYSDLPSSVRNAFGGVSAGCGAKGSAAKCAAALAALKSALAAANLTTAQIAVAAEALKAVSGLQNTAAAQTAFNDLLASNQNLADDFQTATGSITPDEVTSAN